MTTSVRPPSLAETPAAAQGPAAAPSRLQGARGLAARRRRTSAMFPVHPAVADYVALPSAETLRETLVQALRRGEPLVGLTGEAGTGKSMLAMMVVASLRADIRHIACLSSAPATAADVVCHLALAFGMPRADTARQQPARWLLRSFRQRSARGESSLLVLDEAHHLPAPAWFELLLWRDRLRRQGMRLQVFAVGLPALARHLAEPGPDSLLAQPPRMLHIAPLDAWATREYLCVTLRRNGRWGEPALDAAALDALHRRTGGVLGRIQRLASRCLQTAEIFELAAVDAAVVAQQADELGWPEGVDPPCAAAAAARQAAPPAEATTAVRPAPAVPARARRGGRGRVAAVALLAGLVGLAAVLVGRVGSREAELQSAAGTGAVPGVSAPAAGAAPVALGGAATGTATATAMAQGTAAGQPPGPAADAVRGTVVTAATARSAASPAKAAHPANTARRAQPAPARAVSVAARSHGTAASSACSLILTRFSLGEPLSAADRRTLSQHCR